MNAEALQDVLDGLNAERYGRSVWWHRNEPLPMLDDSDISTARRRRAAAEDFGRASTKGVEQLAGWQLPGNVVA